MSGAAVVFQREFAGLFRAPFTWVVLLVVLLLNGLLFNGYLTASGNVSGALDGAMTGFSFWVWMVFLPALLAMRLVAEESRTGTLEYLLTAPVSDLAVVIGKWLAATAFLAVVGASSLSYAGMIDAVGGRPDWPSVMGTWIGTILVSALFVSIGMLASTFTSTPLLAAFLSMVACVSWLLVPLLAEQALGYVLPFLGETAEARASILAAIRGITANMDAFGHFQRSFRIGLFDSSEVIFFLTWTALFLFLTARSLEARRWRG